MKFSLRKS